MVAWTLASLRGMEALRPRSMLAHAQLAFGRSQDKTNAYARYLVKYQL